MITKDTTIEEITEKYPQTLDYLSKNNIRCIRCGEPIWGTLEEAAKEKGYNDEDIIKIIKDLNMI
ncbi:MAG: DUF1858 domain-containing protein [Bacteroidales bacterium]|nr:DUF1858 domain-containing protein [Bacteroidales bacterium]MBN2755536.1 DUF1858 domain-containing protein [Bacteroidales bacterium]